MNRAATACHVRGGCCKGKDGSESVLVWISVGFGSSGFSFGSSFSSTVFGFEAPKPIGIGFGFGFPPVDI